MKKRLFRILLVFLVTAGAFLTAEKGLPLYSDNKSNEEEASYDKGSVYLWYTDDALTDYLSSAAVRYNEEHGTRIIPSLKPGIDFLESINSATIDNNVPDIYIISNDALLKAYLAGLADKITLDTEKYPGAALSAVGYKDFYTAYPFYFDTTALIYNKDYLEDMTIPKTMQEMTELANDYNAPEGVEAFLKWDVTDIFYNYFFLGDAINVGGDAGWDKSAVDIYNENAIRALEEYQNLNQFFSIDTSETDYDKVIDEFIEGKIVFTIATTDVIKRLDEAKVSYGAALIPDMNDKLKTRSLSVVNTAAVNPFSEHMETAVDFARYLTTDYAENLYPLSGKLSVLKDMEFDSPEAGVFKEEFGYSVPLTKMMEASNLWIQLEAAFSGVWDGEDANETLKELAEQMLYQTTGEKRTLDKIELTYEKEEVEYLDEETLRNEALSENE